MTWIFTPRVERPNQRFPTQAREPPVGEGFGGQSEQAPEGGNDSRLVKGESQSAGTSDTWQKS